MVVVLIVTGILMFGGIALLGVPGAIYASMTAPVAELIRGLRPGTMLIGDGAWPIALVMTLAVPPALPLAIWMVDAVRPRAGWVEAAALVVGGVYLWALAVMVGLSF